MTDTIRGMRRPPWSREAGDDCRLVSFADVIQVAQLRATNRGCRQVARIDRSLTSMLPPHARTRWQYWLIQDVR